MGPGIYSKNNSLNNTQNNKSVVLEKSCKLSVSRNRAESINKAVKHRNLRPKYNLNGRKISRHEYKVYESKNSTNNIHRSGNVFEKVMEKFNYNLNNKNIGEGLVTCHRRLSTSKRS